MSKPLTLGQELDMKFAISEWGSRHGQIALNEIDRLRAALAAAEAKLELQGYEYTKALAETELALGADIHALEVKLADERRHANALYECLRELSGPCEYPEHCARYKHHRCRSCSEAKLIDPLLAAHTARRAAEVK